jgi:hypothetical protein
MKNMDLYGYHNKNDAGISRDSRTEKQIVKPYDVARKQKIIFYRLLLLPKFLFD